MMMMMMIIRWDMICVRVVFWICVVGFVVVVVGYIYIHGVV